MDVEARGHCHEDFILEYLKFQRNMCPFRGEVGMRVVVAHFGVSEKDPALSFQLQAVAAAAAASASRTHQ